MDKISPKAALKTIFFANSGGFSSKRVCGVISFFILLGVFIAAFITGKPIPEFANMILVASTSLLGIDSLKNIFSKSS